MRALPETRQIVPAAKPADPLRDSSADVWARWSRDREQRRVEALMRLEAENRALMTAPLYPHECAQRCAEDSRRFVRDWRAIRPQLGAAWGKLLKAQPELSPEMTRQRRDVLNAIVNSLPAHLRSAAGEMHTMIDLMLTAHEAAAYHVGFEAGKLDADQHDRVSYQRTRRRPAAGLRLHLEAAR
jgi:hypothetical protein